MADGGGIYLVLVVTQGGVILPCFPCPDTSAVIQLQLCCEVD